MSSVTTDNIVRLWDLRNEHKCVSKRNLGSVSATVRTISYMPVGIYISTTSNDGNIRVWHLEPNRMSNQPLQANEAGVCSLAVALDGTVIVSGSRDRSVRVWDAETGSPNLQPLLGHEGSVSTVAISPDGRMIASGSTDCTVRLWDVSTGEVAGPPWTCQAEPMQICFSQLTRVLTSVLANGQVLVLTLATGEHRAASVLRCISNPVASMRPLRAVAFAADCKYTACGTFEPRVQLFQGTEPAGLGRETDLDAIVRRLPEKSLRVLAGQLPERYILNAISQLREPHILAAVLKLGEKDLLTVLGQLSRANPVIDQLSDSELRASIGQLLESDLRAVVSQMSESDIRVTIGQSKTWRLRRSDPMPHWASTWSRAWPALYEREPEACDPAPLELRVAIGNLSALDLHSMVDILGSWDLNPIEAQMTDSVMHTAFRKANVTCLVLSDLRAAINQLPPSRLPDALKEASNRSLRSRVNDLSAADVRRIFRLLPESGQRAVFIRIPDSELCTAISKLDDKALSQVVLKLSELVLRAIVNQLPKSYLLSGIARLPDSNLRAAVLQVAELPLDHFVALLSQSNVHAIIDETSVLDLRAAIGKVSKPHLHAILSQLTESDLRAAIRHVPRPISHTESDHHYQSELDEIVRSWREGARSLAFSPDSLRIALGVENGNVYLWPIEDESKVLALPGHSDSVDAIAWSADGRFVASGSKDTTVRLWNADNGQAIRTLHGHTQGVRAVVFTPNGRSIVSGGDDGTIRFWDVEAAADDPFHALSCARRENGWLVGPSGELLLWVPQEYQDYLVMGKCCTNLIAKHRVFLSADEDGLCGGTDWTECWRGPTTLPPL